MGLMVVAVGVLVLGSWALGVGVGKFIAWSQDDDLPAHVSQRDWVRITVRPMDRRR